MARSFPLFKPLRLCDYENETKPIPHLKECPLCKRKCPDRLMERHHMETRRESDETKEICRECHKTIHGLFSNTMLRNLKLNLDSIEGLLSNTRFYKAVKFIRKLEPGERMQMRDSKKKHYS